MASNANAADKDVVVLDMKKRHYDQIVRVEKDEFLVLYALFIACHEADQNPTRRNAEKLTEAYKRAMAHYERQ